MSEALDLTILYEQGEDGWIVSSIPEVPGVHSQGRTHEEARAMVLSALSDWLRFYLEEQRGGAKPEIPTDAEFESVRLGVAA